VVFVVGVVYRLAKDVEHTSIDRLGLEVAEFLVELFGIFALEVGDGFDADIVHVMSDFIAYAGYLLQFGFGHKITSETIICLPEIPAE